MAVALGGGACRRLSQDIGRHTHAVPLLRGRQRAGSFPTPFRLGLCVCLFVGSTSRTTTTSKYVQYYATTRSSIHLLYGYCMPTAAIYLLAALFTWVVKSGPRFNVTQLHLYRPLECTPGCPPSFTEPTPSVALASATTKHLLLFHLIISDGAGKRF